MVKRAGRFRCPASAPRSSPLSCCLGTCPFRAQSPPLACIQLPESAETSPRALARRCRRKTSPRGLPLQIARSRKEGIDVICLSGAACSSAACFLALQRCESCRPLSARNYILKPERWSSVSIEGRQCGPQSRHWAKWQKTSSMVAVLLKHGTVTPARHRRLHAHPNQCPHFP